MLRGGDSRGMGETELKSKANLWIDPKVPFPLGQQKKKKNYVLTEELKKVQTNQVELCVDYIFHIKVICTNP